MLEACEIAKFLLDNQLVDVTVAECQDIITEFDSTADGTMSYEEFLNVFLPATNPSLRDYCLYGYRGVSNYRSQSAELPISISSVAVRILEREKNLCKNRNALKLQLARHADFENAKSFDLISRGNRYIEMIDLIYFLEGNGFHPRTEDLEAILRRCDHDADRALSLSEFAELAEATEVDEETKAAKEKDQKVKQDELEKQRAEQEIKLKELKAEQEKRL